MKEGKGLAAGEWPELPGLEDWEPTLTTVHLWSQVVGKIRLERSPWINHSWGVALYVTTRGLTTSPLPFGGSRTFAVDFDFIAHRLIFETSEGEERSFALEPMSVADFYRLTMEALEGLKVPTKIFARPVEVEEAIPFAEDRKHGSYDAEAMQRYWMALTQANRVFHEFRSRFIGKVSPVHFFWGAFDLAVTRFSGRRAPRHPGGAPNVATWVMEEAYSHELSSAGFWPGPGLGEAAFYSYAYPAPEGYAKAKVEPDAAYYHKDLGEFILTYEEVRRSDDPDRDLLKFLQSTYEAAATLGAWDRETLELRAQWPLRRS